MRLRAATEAQAPARAEGRARAGRAQSRLYRDQGADRRPDRPRQHQVRQPRPPGQRHAGDDRQPGSDLRHLPGHAARTARAPRSDRRQRRADGQASPAAPRRQPLPEPGRVDFLDVRVDQGPTRCRCGPASPIRTASWSMASSSACVVEAARPRARSSFRSRRCRSIRPARSCWWSTRTTRWRSAGSSSARADGTNGSSRRAQGRRAGHHRRASRGSARPGRAGHRSQAGA